jgi:hypothetical protein
MLWKSAQSGQYNFIASDLVVRTDVPTLRLWRLLLVLVLILR